MPDFATNSTDRLREMRTKGEGEGVENPENFADVLYVWSLRAFFGSANVRLGASSLSLCRHLALEFTLSLTRKLINVLNIYKLFMRV